jgi:ubiquinone biosynthesis protein COQ9
MVDPLAMNLDELRMTLAPLVRKHAVFDGWSDAAVAAAAAELGVPADRARLAFKHGPRQMIDAWFDAVDRAMLVAFPPERIEAMKIRDRIRELILFRAAQAALAMLALKERFA